jgi:hypothetical protein
MDNFLRGHQTRGEIYSAQIILQGVYHLAVVIPEARFCEAVTSPQNQLPRDSGATRQELPCLAPGSKDFINLVASPQFMNSGMTTCSFLQNHLC